MTTAGCVSGSPTGSQVITAEPGSWWLVLLGSLAGQAAWPEDTPGGGLTMVLALPAAPARPAAPAGYGLRDVALPGVTLPPLQRSHSGS